MSKPKLLMFILVGGVAPKHEWFPCHPSEDETPEEHAFQAALTKYGFHATIAAVRDQHGRLVISEVVGGR